MNPFRRGRFAPSTATGGAHLFAAASAPPMPRTFTFDGSTTEQVRRFIRETATEMSYLRRVLVDRAGTRVLDVNRDELVFPGVTFGHPLLETILREAGASFDPAILGRPLPEDQPSREFGISAKYPWAHDRVD